LPFTLNSYAPFAIDNEPPLDLAEGVRLHQQILEPPLLRRELRGR
jgi:hypothetical protein